MPSFSEVDPRPEAVLGSPTDHKIQYLGDLQRLSLKHGDILILKLPRVVPHETVDLLRSRMEEQVPGHKVIVLCEGIELGILGKD